MIEGCAFEQGAELATMNIRCRLFFDYSFDYSFDYFDYADCTDCGTRQCASLLRRAREARRASNRASGVRAF